MTYFTSKDFAEAEGCSLPHARKLLRQMKRDGLVKCETVTVRRGQVDDWKPGQFRKESRYKEHRWTYVEQLATGGHE